jgi:hypothetical protein
MAIAGNSGEDLDLRIPIVLGTEGHRDISPQDTVALELAVAKIFDDLGDRYSHTPLVLLSSLAPGGDQLTAEVACQSPVPGRRRVLCEHRAGILSPLPFQPDDYAVSSTFQGYEEAQKKFWEFIGDGTAKCFEVPLPEEMDSTDLKIVISDETVEEAGLRETQTQWFVVPRPEEIVTDEIRRRCCYANAGGYIVRHCLALIALWDGKHTDKLSGTTEMVSWKLEGKAPKLYPCLKPLTTAENGPVYILHTPRMGSTDDDSRMAGECRVKVPGADEPVSPRDLAWRRTWWRRVCQALSLPSGPEQAEWRQFHETCQAIDDFNRDAEKNAAGIKERLGNLSDSLFWKQTDDVTFTTAMRRLLKLREVAATLADRLHVRFRTSQNVLFGLLFLAVLAFDIYTHIPQDRDVHHTLALAAFVVLFVVSVLLVIGVRFLRFAERCLDYRALAEALRVQIFWGAAGIGESVADSYLGQMRNEMAWARRALQNSTPPPSIWRESFERQSLEDQVARLRLVADLWVNKQTDYFDGKFRKHHLCAALLRVFGFGAAAAGWSAAVVLLLGWCRENPPQGQPSSGLSALEQQTASGGAANHVTGRLPEPSAPADHGTQEKQTRGHRLLDGRYPSKWIIFICVALVLLGAFLVAYCERCSYEELAKQYERMKAVSTQGAAEVKDHLDKENTHAAQEVIKALGHEAIAEHVQWLILRRSRPFELLIH